MDRVLLKGALAELFDEGAARFDASMAELTTFRIGGPADVLVEPRTAGEARVVLEACRRLGVAVRVMGLGSDVLVADEGLRCVVVRIAESLSQVEVDGERMHVEAGASNADVARRACEEGLAGYEFACGIPGTVGGAAIMNGAPTEASSRTWPNRCAASRRRASWWTWTPSGRSGRIGIR